MLHYNQLVKDNSVLDSFNTLAMPQIYFASSIKDFAESRREIKPTSLLSEVLFDIRSFQKTYTRGKALVMIPCVRYHGSFWNIVGLEDVTHRISTSIFFPEAFNQGIEKEQIQPGETVSAGILYDTKIDFPYLLFLTKTTFPRSPRFAVEKWASLAELIFSPG